MSDFKVIVYRNGEYSRQLALHREIYGNIDLDDPVAIINHHANVFEFESRSMVYNVLRESDTRVSAVFEDSSNIVTIIAQSNNLVVEDKITIDPNLTCSLTHAWVGIKTKGVDRLPLDVDPAPVAPVIEAEPPAAAAPVSRKKKSEPRTVASTGEPDDFCMYVYIDSSKSFIRHDEKVTGYKLQIRSKIYITLGGVLSYFPPHDMIIQHIESDAEANHWGGLFAFIPETQKVVGVMMGRTTTVPAPAQAQIEAMRAKWLTAPIEFEKPSQIASLDDAESEPHPSDDLDPFDDEDTIFTIISLPTEPDLPAPVEDAAPRQLSLF